MRSLGVKILFLALLVPLTVGAVSLYSANSSSLLRDPAKLGLDPALHAEGVLPAPIIDEAQVRHISDQLRCPVCRGVPISESPSALAQDMTTVIRQKLAEGQTEEQILDYFVEHYGEWILLKPKPHGLNLVIWILPYVLLVSGIGVLAFLVSKWTRKKHS